MSESGKRIFASPGISSSLDTVLATAIGTNYNNRLLTNYKKSNPNLLSEKSLSNNSSKSSSGSSLTLTNNNNSNGVNNSNSPANQFPHHQFYASQQISNSTNWNNNINIRSNSLCSQKVRRSNLWLYWASPFEDSTQNPNKISFSNLTTRSVNCFKLNCDWC